MKILRHKAPIRFTHWVTALSIFILFFSGFGQMPMYKRYMVDQIPGLGWSSNYLITLKLHYFAAMVLIFISCYYVFYLIKTKETDILPRRGDFKESLLIFASMVGLAKEPENDKYLAEQRLAFAVTAFSVLALIITGMIKVIKNLPSAEISLTVTFWATQIHNIFTVVLLVSVIVHLLAFLIKDNRPLVPSMFNGQISASYAARRHRLWMARLGKAKQAAS
ncbi:MAG: formate dehydrogenase subunit gamma [Syntrophomonadaceae bacterium]|jgi:formate dehydrogenase gamma subunit